MICKKVIYLKRQSNDETIYLNKVMDLSKKTIVNHDVTKGVYALFIEKLKNSPEKAIITDDLLNETISYKQLYNLVRDTEIKLLNEGIGRNSIIGVNLERSYKVVAAVLAICKIGAIMVPLDKSYPESYISYIAKDCNTECVISESRSYISENVKHIIPSSIKNLKTDFFEVEREEIFIENYEESDEKINDVRFIYYTSGSTGKPKSICHTEKQILYEFYWRIKGLPINETDIIGQRSPINFVLSLIDMLHGILCGVEIVILPTNILIDPEILSQKIEYYKISWMIMPASIVSLISLLESEKIKRLDTLKTIITGGELLKKSTFKLFHSKFPHIKIIDFYGCTEVLSILYKNITDEEDFNRDFKKVDNLSVYILDENNNILPFGEKGEICVSGIATENAKYYSCGSVDSKKFFDWKNPYTGKTERVYKTGDLGYLTEKGEYHILGRADFSMKINARFVNLKGVEFAISEMPEIRDVAVLPISVSRYRNKVPVAAVVKNINDLNKFDIINFLKAQFPEYMIPKHFCFLDELPRLPNGKTDYKTIEKICTDKKDDSVISDSALSILNEFLGYTLTPDSFDKEFSALGLDSITGTKFIFEISNKLGVSISPAEIYNYPTVNKFLDYLNSLNSDFINPTDNKNYCSSNNDIAVVGMSGIFPDAENIDQFWSNLCDGKDSIREIPCDRWKTHNSNHPECKWGGFLDSIDLFDADFFGISDQEAMFMNPQQRLCLREAYKALKNANYDFKNDTKNVGVFIGASESNYKEFPCDKINLNSGTVLGNDNSIIAAGISYFNDFSGPSLVVNTACSSSLVAVHLACQSLILHECDIAVVGGVNIISNLDFYKKTNALGVFSSTGKCKTFDNDADGFVPGEGVAFLVLKRIEDVSVNEGSYAVIKGSAVNQDGRTNGITAPNGNSQASLQTKLYEKTGINPKDISYIETHGTGTKLGDVVELESLEKVFNRFNVPLKHKCEIGSVKTNIGHLIACSGIAGLIKAILCVHKRKLVSSLNFNTPNKLFNWQESHLNVTTQTKPWDKSTLIAAVSSYGIGGTNAFCIIEESPYKRSNDIAYNQQDFKEKHYSYGPSQEYSNMDIGIDQIMIDNFSGYSINNENTLIENGIESLKLIDFKNYLFNINIVISPEELMNLKVRDLKNIISSKLEEISQNSSKNNKSSNDLKTLSDDELTSFLDKFS